jgi:structural maintenance of chromosome 1
LSAEIEKTAPNLKALDQYEQLREKEQGVVAEFDAARKEEREITEQFNKVKNER